MTRSRFQTQAEADLHYWQDRLVAALAALDAATDELMECRRWLRIAQERLEESRRPPPAPLVPLRINPAWQRRDEQAS